MSKKRKRKRNVDRISLLPDSLIHIIMSFLHIEQVAQTCVLSKRWKNVWTHVPEIKFDFDSYQFKTSRAKHLVLGVLSHHCGTNIEKLSYSTSEGEHVDTFLVEFLVYYARCHMVQKLNLVIPEIECFDWKFCFSGYKTLIALKLTCGFVDEWGSLKLPSLRILEIDNRNEHTDLGSRLDDNMFSGCPNLESLVLCEYLTQSCGICAPKLKNLEVSSVEEGQSYSIELKLSSPNLECVTFTNMLVYVKSASDFPHLDKVHLKFEDIFRQFFWKSELLEYLPKFLPTFHNARSLRLPSDMLKDFLSCPSFNGSLSFRNLKNLKLITEERNKMIDLPVGIAPHFPFLNTLVVDLHEPERVENCSRPRT